MKINSGSAKIFGGALIISGILLGGYNFLDNNVVNVNMRVPEGQDRWEPNEVIVPANKRVRIHINNESSDNHGFAIEVLGINVFIPKLKETIVNVPPSQPGEFEFECSVVCGEGHAEQTGKLIVR